MGRKIFVAYKYADDSVQNLALGVNSTVRDYVNELEKLFDDTDHIYKGEGDDEDLSDLEDETIWAKLKDRIYDSTLTIVCISPKMKEAGVKERDQWIPWEVSYSLKETSRKNKTGEPITSKTNAMIALVLPDAGGSYSYYLEDRSCCSTSCVTHHTDKLFQIIKVNKFNVKNPSKTFCEDKKEAIWQGECSYISAVKWSHFKINHERYIESAYKRRDDIDGYTIVKELA